MKILYLTMALIDPASGVYKKILAQEEAFKVNNECQILFVTDSGNAVWENNGIFSKIDLKKKENIRQVESYLKTCDFCYARFELLRHPYYKKILDLCKTNRIGIVVEIPTYPPYQESMARVKEKVSARNYFGALKTLVGAAIVVLDMYHLVNYSDMMVLVADDTEFKGTKTIRIENGINLDANPFHAKDDTDDGVINIIAVSNFAVWNGYDRAIKGLGEYYHKTGNKDFHLTLVGDKEKAADLIALTKKENIENLVTFTGALSGKELDRAYAAADIALGALGNHRRKVFANSSLKAKEYAARGMLMILSDAEGIEKEVFDECFIVKSDESPIDFQEIAKWYKSIDNKISVRRKIHKYAVQNYSWNSQIDKIEKSYEEIKRSDYGK